MTKKIGPNKYTKSNSYDIKQPQIILDPEKFNAAIASYGIRLEHSKITLCPNFVGNLDSNEHQLGCELCGGSNFVHFDAQEIWGVFSQNALVENFFAQGFWDRGSALLTVPTHLEKGENFPIYISYFDKVILLDFKERFYEVLHKSDGDKDILKYEALDINYLRTTEKEYHYHKDFKLNDEGNIIWISPNRPKYNLEQEMGEIFTVSYLRRPVYRVVELLHEGRYSQFHFKEKYRKTVRYPQQVLIKKDFLIEKPEIEKGLTKVETAGGVIIPG